MFLPTLLLIAGTFVMVTSMSCPVGDSKLKGTDVILQVCMDGMTYMDVCYFGWSEDEAAVRCRSRDRPGPLTNWQESTSSLTGTAINITCLGTEVSLAQCNYTVVEESCTRVLASLCFMCVDLACPDTATCINDRYCKCNNTCQNNGSCHAGVCYCPDGFTGDSCENMTCPVGCENGGTCLSNGTCQFSQPISSQPNFTEDMTSPITITTEATKESVVGVTTSPIIYSAPVVIILIVIILIVLVIVVLLFCLSRIRKSKSTPISQSPEELYSEVILHSMAQPQSEGCINEVVYDSMIESNPYMESNMISPTYSSVYEEAKIPPPYDKRKFSVENEIYAQLGLSVFEDDIYQTYENACQLPFAGSSTVVPRYESQDEIANEIPKELSNMQSEQKPESYFEQEGIYWEPQNNLGLIFNQMADRKFREIAESAIIRQEKIGSGQFGNVYKGLWYTSGNEPNPFLSSEPIPVAIKTLHDSSTLDLKTTFIQEAAIMGQFSHPNVLRLLGIVSRTEPYMIVTELMHTELLKFLITIRDSTLQHSVMQSLFLNFSRQIASGMTYLSSKHFIHRDLAARNVLIARDLTCRIADFGLSRQLRDEGDYYTSKGGKIPLKWSAPEAIFYKRYSEKSDVWSFGMTLYEIWSIGEKPWSGYSNEDVLLALSKSEVLNRPKTCPQGIFSVMLECWNPNNDLRPSFLQVSQMLAVSEISLLDTIP